jgi:heme-degrading monooxygenase HmoA
MSEKSMIARIWRAEALTAHAPAYSEHFANHVVPQLKRARGYEGALLLNHEFNGAVNILVITFWKSLNSVKQFAGADIKRAVIAEDAKDLLVNFETEVRHFEVVKADGVGGVRIW